MTRIADDLRAVVRERAARCCEYCRLPDRLQIGGFEIDHIVPVSRGGATAGENLAYACPHCNDRKWAHVVAADPMTGVSEPLFHPRLNRWEDHFEWSRDVACEIYGTSATGGATVGCLQLNHPELVAIRRELVHMGLLVISS
jgi:hypothetical protein